MQPESPPITISADGKCLHPIGGLASVEQLDVIELIIDGSRIKGGIDSPTLLGNEERFLTESSHYALSEFKPMANGCCLARYTREKRVVKCRQF